MKNEPSLFKPDETTKKFLPPDFVKNLDDQRGTGITYEPKTKKGQPNKLKRFVGALLLTATVILGAKVMNDRIGEDRIFHPERGNPEHIVDVDPQSFVPHSENNQPEDGTGPNFTG
jgi:hypothetical protein